MFMRRLEIAIAVVATFYALLGGTLLMAAITFRLLAN